MGNDSGESSISVSILPDLILFFFCSFCLCTVGLFQVCAWWTLCTLVPFPPNCALPLRQLANTDTTQELNLKVSSGPSLYLARPASEPNQVPFSCLR
ncbi:hypothetical protein BJX61DRAFT_506643 [Aspergillus egyptiacus]|nr:hypothetical protein BJX61DRAFT_506643 [Aspergillus egyptiacus]